MINFKIEIRRLTTTHKRWTYINKKLVISSRVPVNLYRRDANYVVYKHTKHNKKSGDYYNLFTQRLLTRGSSVAHEHGVDKVAEIFRVSK